MWKCPVCGGDPLGDDSAAQAAIAPFITSSHCNPGGRTLELDDGTQLNLGEWCNLCDAAVVADYLRKRMARDHASPPN